MQENRTIFHHLIRYLPQLSLAKTVLWCYLIWYFVIVGHHFDAKLSIWLSSIGLSGIIGIALVLSTANPQKPRRDKWELFRLFTMPFCVSSFSALIKDKGFILIFSPNLSENVIGAAVCAVFVGIVVAIKRFGKRR